MNVDGREAISDIVAWHREKYNSTRESRPLFPSRNKRGYVAMNRQTAHEMLKKAFQDAGLNGKLATHSLRKSFAQRLYEESGAIYLVQELLGHQNITTTQSYLGVNYASARKACEGMVLGSEPYIFSLLGSSLKKEADETLFLELALRGGDLASLRENEAAEIVKIG